MSDQFDFSQILAALAEPFPSEEVEFKPGALNSDKTKALALAYVDSRPYIQRLNLVCPDWQDEYQVTMLPDRVVVLCKLTINGVTRTGDGECQLSAGEKAEENAVTTASAQAFKRACVKFGLGAYLYALPQVWCDYDHAKRKITNPPQLPRWAVPAAEQEAREANDQALAEARKARIEKTLTEANGNASKTPASTPATAEDNGGDANPGEAKVYFGKMNGKTLAQVWAEGKEGQGWVRWCANTDGKGFDPKGKAEAIHLQRMARAFLMLNAAYAG